MIISYYPKSKIIIINSNCLKVDNTIIFLKLFSKLAITPDINIVKIEIELKITLTFVSIKKLLNELLNTLQQLLKLKNVLKLIQVLEQL